MSRPMPWDRQTFQAYGFEGLGSLGSHATDGCRWLEAIHSAERLAPVRTYDQIASAPVCLAVKVGTYRLRIRRSRGLSARSGTMND